MANLTETTTSNYTLRQFSQLCLYGRPLRLFANKILEESRDYYANNPYSYLLSTDKLLNFQIHRYIKNLELFQRLHMGDTAFFKMLSTYENTGPFSATNVLFYPAVEYLGSKEQHDYFSREIQAGRVIGSYAQTEIGHGSDIQSLQTTATFDPAKKCLIFNTPDTASFKYWPAGLGLFCTHVIAQGRLLVNSKSYGIQTFVIQVRDPKTLKTLPGVNIGQIGPKLGFRHIDNGFLQFTNFEAPLDTLLARYIQIDQEGNVTKSKDKNSMKIMYGSMMTLRGGLFRYFTALISKTLQMTYNYKTQDKITGLEARKSLDELSNYFSFILSTKYMRELFEEFFSSYHSNIEKALDMLKEIHFATTGFKVFSSWEVIRLSRENATQLGLGNLILSGIVQQYSDAVPTSTFEGDNTVMLLQVIRVALAYYKDLMMGNSISGPMSFLNKYQKYAMEDIAFDQVIEIHGDQDISQKADLLLENFVFKSLQELTQKFKKAVFEDQTPMEVVISDKMQTGIVKLSLKVFEFVNYQIAKKAYHDENTKSMLNKKDIELIEKLMQLQKVNYIKSKLNDILISGVMKSDEKIEESIIRVREDLYLQLLPDLDYLYNHTLVTKTELSSVEDFRKLGHPNYDSLKDKVTKEVQHDLIRLSKL